MAKTKDKVKKPASKQPAVKKQPAAKSKSDGGVSVRDVAKKVGRNERSVRSSIRRILGGGSQVGKGGRYSWRSWNDPELKKIMSALKAE